MNRTHELKILPEYFEAIKEGKKTFEVRYNDRNFQVGDTLLLKEWYDGKYTSRAIEKEVIYILYDKSGYAIDGYVIMSIV